ncbi:hypothetical protein BGX28_002535 [Mortierella sp. GBA30]|nr:hypothetical protein BGX28_002535 [Mortierella sp. GBA30]
MGIGTDMDNCYADSTVISTALHAPAAQQITYASNKHFENRPIQPSLYTLPTEVLFYIMNSLLPRDILRLSHVSTRIRTLSVTQLSYAWDIIIVDPKVSFEQQNPLPQTMSSFELYVRILLSELCGQETDSPAATDDKGLVDSTLICCKNILRRVYLIDRINVNWNSGVIIDCAMPDETDRRQISSLSPYITTVENLHVVARVVADLVCRGHCLPETAVLVLQTLTTLRDQDQFQYLMNTAGRNTTSRLPTIEDKVSIGQLCFQYLIPNIMALLKPSISPSTFTSAESVNKRTGHCPSCLSEQTLVPPQETRLHVQPNMFKLADFMSGCRRSMTGYECILPSQQALLFPLRIRSVTHLTRVLCFLPLLGRHFNTLPTSTFIETFLDRSKGDLRIDRAAVMVYGFMCVLDLESGKANLAAESYRIFERSMPTQGVVQAEEMKALGMPEILACIGEHLSNRDIINCVCVNKFWKQEFEHKLWRSFILEENMKGLGLDLMERNAPYIHTLDVYSVDPAKQAAFFRNCSQLKNLTFYFHHGNFNFNDDEKKWDLMADLIKSLPQLRKLVIDQDVPSRTPNLFKTLPECPKLVILETSGCMFDMENTSYFRAVGSPHLKCLSSKGDSFFGGVNFPDDLWLPEMLYLDIKYAYQMSNELQLKWISHCPKLISIAWEESRGMSVEDFCRVIPSACPNLTSLQLCLHMSDEDIAAILNAMPRVEKLTVPNMEFGDLSGKALRKHYSWLKDINFEHTLDLTSLPSLVVQEILCSCPALQSVGARFLYYKHLAALPQPWVCKGLQVFNVGISFGDPDDDEDDEDDEDDDEDEEEEEKILQRKQSPREKARAKIEKEVSLWRAHRDLFSRLGQLTELQHLSIGFLDDGLAEPEESPKLTLKAGLKSLETLKKLKFFSCRLAFDMLTTQEIVETVKWMAEHWPKLESLEGRIEYHLVYSVHERVVKEANERKKLVQYLKDRGIKFEEYQGGENEIPYDCDFDDDEYEAYEHDYEYDDEYDDDYEDEDQYEDEDEDDEENWEDYDDDGDDDEEADALQSLNDQMKRHRVD